MDIFSDVRADISRPNAYGIRLRDSAFESRIFHILTSLGAEKQLFCFVPTVDLFVDVREDSRIESVGRVFRVELA